MSHIMRCIGSILKIDVNSKHIILKVVLYNFLKEETLADGMLDEQGDAEL